MPLLTTFPAIGDGITEPQYTDAHAYTVVGVTAKGFTAQRDRVTFIPNPQDTFAPGGFVGHWTEPSGQAYSYEADQEAPVVRFTLRADGTFRRGGGKPVLIGRHEYYDRNF